MIVLDSHAAYNTLLIKVYSYDDKKNMSGSIYDIYSNVNYIFSNVTGLILKIEEFLDCFPGEGNMQKKDIYDSAINQKRYDFIEKGDSCSGIRQEVIKTFRLQICFRKFDTWQGILSCIESGSSNEFRNIMEMLLMMDSELEAAAASKEVLDAVR